jgi:hypothetical protein
VSEKRVGGWLGRLYRALFSKLSELGRVPFAQNGDQFASIIEYLFFVGFRIRHHSLNPQASLSGLELTYIFLKRPQIDFGCEPLIAFAHSQT